MARQIPKEPPWGDCGPLGNFTTIWVNDKQVSGYGVLVVYLGFVLCFLEFTTCRLLNNFDDLHGTVAGQVKVFKLVVAVKLNP